MWGESGSFDGGSGGVGGCAEGWCDEGSKSSTLSSAGALGDVAVDVPGAVAGGDGEDGVALAGQVVASAGPGGKGALKGKGGRQQRPEGGGGQVVGGAGQGGVRRVGSGEDEATFHEPCQVGNVAEIGGNGALDVAWRQRRAW